MRKNEFAIRHSILINKPREVVWDYTQNYANRTAWDNSVLTATVLQTTPNRIVKLKMTGGTTMTYVYKLDDRPNKTTLVARDVSSPIIESIGGAWTYDDHGRQTLWTQAGTVVLKKHFLVILMLPMCKFALKLLTKKAMQKAKRAIEKL